MNIMTAITSEERKLENEIRKLQKQLNGLKSAEKALRSAGHTGHNGTGGTQKRVLSPEARARISRAAKRRWAKARMGANKAAA
jgi:50S ribosomal subunit-associated GTPase HflX